MKTLKHQIRVVSFILLALMVSSSSQAQSFASPGKTSNLQFSNKTIIENITVIDVETQTLQERMSIVIENDKIHSIFPSDSQNTADNTAKVFAMEGHYVIPGLIDSHVHLFRPKHRKQILKDLLYSGVTSVRDMGGDARMYQKLSKEINEGTLEAPDIYYSATMFGPAFLKDPRTKFAARGFEPGEAPWMRVITDETNLEHVVAEAKKAGVTGIKLYSNISPELLTAVSEEAHSQGLKVWSHSSIFPSKPGDAGKAGVDVISHALGMIAESADEMPESFGEAIRNFMPAQDFKNADALSPEFVSLFKILKSNGTIFEPTISAAKTPLQAAKKAKSETTDPTKHLTQAAKKLDRAGINQWVKRITKAAYDNGVTISAGTDLSKDIKWVQDEIIFLAECGLINFDAIKAATINNALAIGIEKSHGSIAIGKQANLVVLSKNPLENIQNIRSVKMVFKDGKSYSKTLVE